MDKKQEIKTLQNNFYFFIFSKDRKRKLIKGKIFDNEIKKGGRKKKLIIKMSRFNHIWGWLQNKGETYNISIVRLICVSDA